MSAIAGAAGLLGLISKQAAAMSKELGKGASAQFKAAGQNMADAFGPRAARSAAGPLTAALDAAEAKARNARKSVDTVTKATFEAKGIEGQSLLKSVSAVDSRSSEGVKEMFRLMRGAGDDIQEQQLGVLETIADNTADMGIDVEELEFAR